MEVSGLLREARFEALLTQRQLAKRVGIAASSLSRYESGRAQPSLPMLDRILAACGKQVRGALEHLHADLDAELDALAAQSHRERLWSIEFLTPDFVQALPDGVVIGSAWAAALHGLPHEHDSGRLWLPDDPATLDEMTAMLKWRHPWLYVDGEPTSPFICLDTWARHPVARWRSTTAGFFETVVVPAGDPWPVEVRLDADLGTLRVIPGEHLRPEDGVRPDVLDRWLARRAAGPRSAAAA